MVTPSDGSQCQQQPTSALGEVKAIDVGELHSRSALDGPEQAANKVDSHAMTMGTAGNKSAKQTRSFKSSRSRHSFAHSTNHFNPIRFLAMGLIEKNQERKEIERKK